MKYEILLHFLTMYYVMFLYLIFCLKIYRSHFQCNIKQKVRYLSGNTQLMWWCIALIGRGDTFRIERNRFCGIRLFFIRFYLLERIFEFIWAHPGWCCRINFFLGVHHFSVVLLCVIIRFNCILHIYYALKHNVGNETQNPTRNDCNLLDVNIWLNVKIYYNNPQPSPQKSKLFFFICS